MPLLKVTNLTTSPLSIQGGGYTLKVGASATVTGQKLDDDQFQAIESQLKAMQTGSKLTYSVSDDPDTQGDNALASNVANGSMGMPVVIIVNVPDAATGDVDTAVTEKIEILDVVVQKRGGAGGAANLVRVKSTAANITDDMDINVADQTIVRPTTIDDANSTIAAGGVLRITRTKAGGNAACLVTVFGVKRA